MQGPSLAFWRALGISSGRILCLCHIECSFCSPGRVCGNILHYMSHGQNKQRSSKKYSAKTSRKWLKMAKHCKTKQPMGPFQKRYPLSFTLGSCSRFWWCLMISFIFAGVLDIRSVSMPCMFHVCMCGWMDASMSGPKCFCNIEASSL